MTTTDSHHLDEEQLSSLVDERLEPAERARAEAHLDDCARCREQLEGLRATVALLRDLPELEPPRSFELAEATRRPLALRLAPWTRAAGALAAALFVMLVSADLLGGPGGPLGGPPAGAPAPAVPQGGAKPAEAPRLAAPAAPAAPAQDRSAEAARSAQQHRSAAAGASGADQAPTAAPPAAAPQAAPTEPTGATPAARLAPTMPPAPAPVAPPQAPAGSLLRAGEVATALLAAVLLLASFFLPRLARRPR